MRARTQKDRFRCRFNDVCIDSCDSAGKPIKFCKTMCDANFFCPTEHPPCGSAENCIDGVTQDPECVNLKEEECQLHKLLYDETNTEKK